MISLILHKISLFASRNYLKHHYGNAFYLYFKKISTKHLKEILPHVPSIGPSLFLSSYHFGAPYIAWLKTYLQLGLSHDEIELNIWKMNELLICLIPKCLRPFCGKIYFSTFRNKVAKHLKRQQQNKLHPYDWTIAYREINETTFEFDIFTCGFKKLAADFGVPQLLPTICRMDYLFAHLLHNGFERRKTLGDGDDCCNCRYIVGGTCEWSIAKNFFGPNKK